LPRSLPPTARAARRGEFHDRLLGESAWRVWLDDGMSASLSFLPALSRADLLAAPVAEALRAWPGAEEVQVAEIDPALADTAAFCERYGVAPAESANCVVIAARRGDPLGPGAAWPGRSG
jgi:hypothetical protein